MTGEGPADPAGKNGRNALAGISGMPCSGGLPDTGYQLHTKTRWRPPEGHGAW